MATSIPVQIIREQYPILSEQDLANLTYYKWRYSLETHGFTSHQARTLIFLRWMRANGRLGGKRG